MKNSVLLLSLAVFFGLSQAALAANPDNFPNSILTVTLDSVHHPTCLNTNGGAVFISVGGGTAPYSFLWSNNATTEDAIGLPSGLYSVTVTDAEGDMAELEDIPLSALPNAILSADGDITCSHPTVRLDGSSSTVGVHTTFEWSAPAGVSTDSLVVFTEVAGTYTLTLTDTLTGCTSTDDYTVDVDTLAPTVNAGSDVNTACTNTAMSLTGTASVGPGHTYTAQWTATNGGHIVAGADQLLVDIDHTGTYSLTVQIIENGCSATDAVIVTGDNAPPSLTVTGGTLNCTSSTVQLSAQTDAVHASFVWTGPGGFTSNELNPSVDEAGSYVLTITDTLTTCESVATAEVLADFDAPVLTATGGTITCTNPSVTLAFTTSSPNISLVWSGPNGFTSTSPSPHVIVAGAYQLAVTDTSNGCTATATATVAADTISPIANAGPNATLTCTTTSLQLGGMSTSQGPQFVYAWTTTGGHFVGATNAATATVDDPGTYVLTVTNTVNGCVADDLTVVNENITIPPVSAQGGTINCFTPTVTLMGNFSTNNTTFGWTGPNGYTSNQQNPTVSVAGPYILRVTNTLNGCTNSATATVSSLNYPPGVQATGGLIGCNLAPVTLHATAQGNGVTFMWTGPNGFTSNLQNPSVSNPGVYTVKATDGLTGCTATATASVTYSTTPPTAVAGGGFSLGCNTTSGKLNGTGSTVGIGIVYFWTTANGHIVSGANTLMPTVNAVGTYTLTVTNAMNGCTATASVSVTQAPPMTVTLTSMDAFCYGSASGSITSIVSGGTGTITYDWSNGVHAPVAFGLVAGAYTVIVRDANGCSATATATIGQPATAVSITTSSTPQTNPALNNGTASANASGGTPPYFYAWSNGATNQNIANLAPGAYVVTVTDHNNCTASATVNVNAASCNLGATVSSTTNVACFGNTTGSATVSVTGSINPIQYAWSNGTTTSTPTRTGLAAGAYSVTVTDNSGCSVILTFNITQPTAALTVTELLHTNVPCPAGSNSGSITAAVNGGTQPYSYAWSNGSTAASISNLGVGTYMLTVTDSKGCKANLTSVIIGTDTHPPVLVLQNVTISLNANGQASVTAAQFNAGSSDNCGIASWSASPLSFNCTHLGTNTVNVTATDVNGLQSTGTAQVIVEDHVIPSLVCPASMTVAACHATVNFNLPTVSDNCSLNMALLTQTSGLPSGANFPVGTTMQAFKYTDATGNTGTCNFQVTVAPALTYNAGQTDATCDGACNGSISLTHSGGLQPVNVAWSSGSNGSNLCAGNYFATISDAGGCSQVLNFNISEPAPLGLSLTHTNPACPSELSGTIQAIVEGGSGSYEYVWSNSNTTSSLFGLGAGSYTVVVTDANGCSITETVTLSANDQIAPTLVLHNAIVTLGANGSVALSPTLFDAGTTDNCGIASWTISPTSLSCGSLGLQTVNLSVTDINGNVSTGTAMVTVTDNIAPAITCPASITAGSCEPTATFNLPTVTDNCAFNPTSLVQTNGLPSGSDFPTGVTTQAFSYTDAAGNAATCSFTVTVGTSMILTPSFTDVTCYDACDGSASVTIAGGATPISVIWSNGQTSTALTDLCEGTYEVTATDADGCLQILEFVITEPTALQFSVDSVSNDVNDEGTGAISISVGGGTAPYSYAWSFNGAAFSSDQNLSGIGAGDYSVIVTDTNGCTVSSVTITVENLTATHEPSWSEGASLQPNPASAHATLILKKHLTAPLEIVISDVTGRIVQRQSFQAQAKNRFDLDVAGLAAGVYNVQLRSAGSMAMRRLVVSR